MKLSFELHSTHLVPELAAQVIGNEVCRPRKDDYYADMPDLTSGVEINEKGNIVITLEAMELTKQHVIDRMRTILPNQIEFEDERKEREESAEHATLPIAPDTQAAA